MIKHRYLFAALATLAVATTAQAARYWLASDVVKNTTPGNAQGYANTLTLTSDDPSDPVDPIVIKDVRQDAANSRRLVKYNRENGVPPFDGCAYGGADLDLTLPIKDADGNVFTLVGLANESFQDNFYVGSVKFPSTLTFINQYAFRRCRYLREYSFPDGTDTLTTMQQAIFDSCDRLQFAEWPANIRDVTNHMFNGDKGLIGFYGPAVTNVQSSAFNSCSSLKMLEFGSGFEFTGNNVLQNISKTTCEKFLFHAGPPVVNAHFTGNGEGNSVFDWITFGGADFYIPLNATGDGPTAEWATFKTDFEADDAGNAVTWPTPNGDGTWTAGSIYSARHKRSAGLYYWDPATTTTSALLAY